MAFLTPSQRAKEPSKGRINQASNQDLNGLRQRGGVSAEEARELRRKLRGTNVGDIERALNRVAELLKDSPSRNLGNRHKERGRGGDYY